MTVIFQENPVVALHPGAVSNHVAVKRVLGATGSVLSAVLQARGKK